VQPADPGHGPTRTMTLEAYADTLVPGERRSPHDRAIAGAAPGGGAVAAGAIELLQTPATGLSTALDDFADALNVHAAAYASEHGLAEDSSAPQFVALSFADRTALVQALTAPGHPEKEIWVGLALFCFMAFDTAAHLKTVDAIAAGHPGRTAMGFAKPDVDGLWRFPDYSYGRPLARLHPDTTSSGSPA
jgi:enediyne biosynthesis protein E8